MNEELSKNTADSEITTEMEVDNKSTEPFRTFNTEDEFKRYIQSEKSKAKNDLLKELGVQGVSEFSNLKSTYEKAIEDKKEITDNLTRLQNENTALNEKNILLELNVDDRYADDTLTLARSKVSDTVNLKDAVEEVLKKNPNWKNNTTGIRIGIEKTNNEPENTDDKTMRVILGRLGI